MPNLTPVPMRKTRPVDNPYEVYSNQNGWEWRVLKSSHKDRETPYARAFCAVSSPYVTGYEYGDTYWTEILRHGVLIETNYGE